MPIKDEAGWKKCQENNQDGYGKCIVEVAREVMRLLDERPGPFDPHKLISEADDNIKAGGITGFMAGAAASIVSGAHSRGEEFRRAWNKEYGIESDKPGVVNPAILTIDTGK